MKTKNLLVFTQSYPNQNKIEMNYVHTRNKYYQSRGFNVKVISFSAMNNYEYNGVSVLSKEHYKIHRKKIDQNTNIFIFHAPNIRNHFPLLFSMRNRRNIVIFFHGHEILNINKHYPKPYSKLKNPFNYGFFRKCYDKIKLKIWKISMTHSFDNFKYVFVSQWLYEQFIIDSNINRRNIEKKSQIINNSLGKEFLDRINRTSVDKSSDTFKQRKIATFRTNMDSPKYGIDLVVAQALINENLEFHVYAETNYFEHYPKPKNLKLFNKALTHSEIIKKLPAYDYIYMPTRLDAQGVMACELATINIDLVVSDIPIMREMVGDFDNVTFIPNQGIKWDFIRQVDEKKYYSKKTRFSNKNTVEKEVELFKKISKGCDINASNFNNNTYV